MVKLTTRATVEVCIKTQQMENRRAQCAEPEENAGRAITCPTKILQEEKNLQLREKICAKPLKIQKKKKIEEVDLVGFLWATFKGQVRLYCPFTCTHTKQVALRNRNLILESGSLTHSSFHLNGSSGKCTGIHTST